MGGAPRDAGEEPWSAGENAVRGSAAPAAWGFPGRPAAYTSAPVEEMASAGGASQGGVLRATVRARRAVPVGLHEHERAGNSGRGATIRPPGLPLRAPVLELGVGDGVFHGELREPERGVAERALEARGCSESASHGSSQRRGASRDPSGDVHRSLQGAPGPLRNAGPSHPGEEAARERRRGAEPPSFETSDGPGLDAAWEP